MSRRFAFVTSYAAEQNTMPARKTSSSAGYDIAAARDVELAPRSVALVPTGLKAYMESSETLLIYIRSSLAVKQGLCLANGVGVIDADYVDNPDNEGHIQIALFNPTEHMVFIRRGQAIAQGIFTKYLITDDDNGHGERTGGFGSTDRQV